MECAVCLEPMEPPERERLANAPDAAERCSTQGCLGLSRVCGACLPRVDRCVFCHAPRPAPPAAPMTPEDQALVACYFLNVLGFLNDLDV